MIKHCDMEMNQKVGNLDLTRDGIEITLVGAAYSECVRCGHIELRSDVDELVSNLLEQKKEAPDSPPYLYVNVPELLDC